MLLKKKVKIGIQDAKDGRAWQNSEHDRDVYVGISDSDIASRTMFALSDKPALLCVFADYFGLSVLQPTLPFFIEGVFMCVCGVCSCWHARLCLRVCACTGVCACACVCLCVSVCACVCVCVCLCVRECLCLRLCVFYAALCLCVTVRTLH